MIRFDERYFLQLEPCRGSVSVLAEQECSLALLNPLPGERILDLGCGVGGFCRGLAPLVAPGGHVIGVDLSLDAIALANRLSADADLDGLAFELGDGHHLRFADASFDAVTCISVLGFCQDPSRALAELRRVLRPEGRLLLAHADEEAPRYSGGDGALGRRIRQAIATRGLDPRIAQRLVLLLQEGGFHVLRKEMLSGFERHYSPGAAGYTLARALRDYLLESGAVSAVEYDRWLAELAARAREGSYGYTTTTFVYLAQVRAGA
jgi:arsenite methyltransferase